MCSFWGISPTVFQGVGIERSQYHFKVMVEGVRRIERFRVLEVQGVRIEKFRVLE